MTGIARDDILAAARGWIGTPYVHQAALKGVGCDCLGLLRGVWRDLYGIDAEAPPPYAPDWAEASGIEALAEAGQRHLEPVAIGEARPGDVLLFRWRAHLPAKHVAILATDTTIIHAHEGACVCEAPFGVWQRRISHAFRFPGVPG